MPPKRKVKCSRLFLYYHFIWFQWPKLGVVNSWPQVGYHFSQVKGCDSLSLKHYHALLFLPILELVRRLPVPDPYHCTLLFSLHLPRAPTQASGETIALESQWSAKGGGWGCGLIIILKRSLNFSTLGGPSVCQEVLLKGTYWLGEISLRLFKFSVIWEKGSWF